MKRSEVRDLIEEGINALGNQIAFRSGRITEFNKDRTKEYPFIWLESLQADTAVSQTVTNIDDWDIVMHIAARDKADSVAAEYEKIIDSCDYIAQQLIKQYAVLLDTTATAVMKGVKRRPFIHKHADDTTGIILSFTLTVPDTTDVCA